MTLYGGMTLSGAAIRRKKASHLDPDDAASARPALLLAWYDRHRRRLPWRPLPGALADPYRVWLSEIMLQQTGVKTVGPYFEKFVARWPDVETLGRASRDEKSRAGDSAQALMDFGASICTPKKPACSLCPLNDDCVARARGDRETFPRKAPKKAGTLRRGAAFVITRGDQLLVRSRPEKGLLGGMTEVPTSHWRAAQDDKTALQQAPGVTGIARWHRKAGVVTHVFTHFPLELVVYTARVAARAGAPEGMRWVPIATLKDEALPNVMRKVISHRLAPSKLRSE